MLSPTLQRRLLGKRYGLWLTFTPEDEDGDDDLVNQWEWRVEKEMLQAGYRAVLFADADSPWVKNFYRLQSEDANPNDVPYRLEIDVNAWLCKHGMAQNSLSYADYVKLCLIYNVNQDDDCAIA